MAGDDKAKTGAAPVRRRVKTATDNGPVGNALRAAYRSAVEEQVPDDLLDLLKKLT